MAFMRKNVFGKILKTQESVSVEENLEQDMVRLKEIVTYSQHLTCTGSWTYDIQRDEAFWTEEVYRILECDLEDLDHKFESFLKFIHPDDLEEVLKAIKRSLKGEEYNIEYRIIISNNIKKYINEKITILFNDNNMPIKIIGIIQDITEKKLIEKNLKELGKDFNQAQRVAGVGSWKYDALRDEVVGSEEMYRIFGVKPRDFKNDLDSVIKLVHSEDQIKLVAAMEKYLEGEFCEVEYRIPQPDGSDKYVIGRGEPLFNEKGQVIGIIGTIQDITENRELQNQVCEIKKRFEILIQESSDIFEIIEPDGTIKYISNAITRFIDYSPEDLVGVKMSDPFKGENLQKLLDMLDFVLANENKKVQGDIAIEDKNGKYIYFEVTMQNLLNDPSIEGIAVNYRDITRRIDMEKRMVHISTHDQLTELPNRVFFNSTLRARCESCKDKKDKFTLMMLDIDGLKYVNYSLGYELGDKIILEIVQRLKNFLNKDEFISRYSDDHFAIIAPELKTYEECTDIAEGIIDVLSKPYKVEGYEFDISVNIGIRICTGDAECMNSLRNQAKVALSRAKKRGRNTYEFHSSDLDIQNYKESILRSDLHHAIEREELRVYYQPIVNVGTNDILGAEALIRWEHPKWGMVSPDEFISMAEETGLIIDIGKWVLKKVCQDYKRWIESNLPVIKVSANFSSIQFLEDEFVKHIKDIIQDYKLDPEFLIMEITESVLLKESDKIISDMEELRSFGLQIALDDFGTGFSSLGYLNCFNIDILKIDESFIKNVPSEYTSTAITKSIINLAKELKIKLIVEGIENWEQLFYLRELNCYAGQGFIYSKPVTVEEFEKILAEKRCKPSIVNDITVAARKDRRKLFRIKFYQLLEADMTILEFNGEKVEVGNTKVLIKDIGPGGLCFISTIKFPVERGLILQFTTELLGEEVKGYGSIAWMKERDDDLYEYGIEFTFDENERSHLIKNLNQVQVKMKNNILFAHGRFTPDSASIYFKSNLTKNKQ